MATWLKVRRLLRFDSLYFWIAALFISFFSIILIGILSQSLGIDINFILVPLALFAIPGFFFILAFFGIRKQKAIPDWSLRMIWASAIIGVNAKFGLMPAIISILSLWAAYLFTMKYHFSWLGFLPESSEQGYAQRSGLLCLLIGIFLLIGLISFLIFRLLAEGHL